MKQRLVFLFILISIASFSQYNTPYRSNVVNSALDQMVNEFEIQIFPEELDSLKNNRKSLEDGEITIYWSKYNKTPHFKFSVIDGNVDGTFYCWNKYGILTTVGQYSNDSTWSFIQGYFLVSDTTFKSGTWRYYGLSNPIDSTYYSGHITERNYKIKYDNYGKYTEKWYYLSGQIWEDRCFTKEDGLIYSVIYNSDGTKYRETEVMQNCTLGFSWDETGDLKNIFINDKMYYWICLKRGDEEFFHYKLKDPQNKREELTNPDGFNFQTRLFYPNGNIMEFEDRLAGIKILYDENGQVIKVEKRKGVKIKRMK
jgi:hypothetical protein